MYLYYSNGIRIIGLFLFGIRIGQRQLKETTNWALPNRIRRGPLGLAPLSINTTCCLGFQMDVPPWNFG